MAFASDCVGGASHCNNEIPVITIGQKTDGNTSFAIVDRLGNPVNLTDYMDAGMTLPGERHGVFLTAKEMIHDVDYVFDVQCKITDAEKGVVEFTYAPAQTPFGGIWVAQSILWKDNQRINGYPLYVEIEQLYDVYNTEMLAPITIPELRLAMRDKCPSDNFLLEDYEFSNTELAWAIRRPIELWNETPPPIGVYTPKTFPYRYHWLQCSMGELMLIASKSYMRNHLQYKITGGNVDDKNKYRDYATLGEELRNEFKEWMTKAKTTINALACYGTTTGIYYGGYYRGQRYG